VEGPTYSSRGQNRHKHGLIHEEEEEEEEEKEEKKKKMITMTECFFLALRILSIQEFIIYI
jgi:hypothetical protein